MSKMFKLFTTILFLMSLNPTISSADDLYDSWANCRANEDSNICNGSCTRNALGELFILDNSLTDADQSTSKKPDCSETPDSYKLRFYKVGLCTADPLATSGSTNPTGDFEGCYNFFDKSSDTTDAGGTSVVLATTDSGGGLVTADTNLLENIDDFKTGTYSYAYAILSNVLELKHSDNFSEPVRGINNSTGKVCWTIDKTTTYTNEAVDIRNNTTVIDTTNADVNATLRTMKCGDATDATFDYAKEILDDFADDPGTEPFSAGYGTWFTFPDTTVDLGSEVSVKLLQNDNLTNATSANNAERIFYGMKFATPVVIDADTTTFKLDFYISNTVFIGTKSDGQNNLVIVKNGAEPFQISVEAN
jgi:hypothetical protein